MKYIKIWCNCGETLQQVKYFSIKDSMDSQDIDKLTNRVFLEYKRTNINIILNYILTNKNSNLSSGWSYISEQEYKNKIKK